MYKEKWTGYKWDFCYSLILFIFGIISILAKIFVNTPEDTIFYNIQLLGIPFLILGIGNFPRDYKNFKNPERYKSSIREKYFANNIYVKEIAESKILKISMFLEACYVFYYIFTNNLEMSDPILILVLLQIFGIIPINAYYKAKIENGNYTKRY